MEQKKPNETNFSLLENLKLLCAFAGMLPDGRGAYCVEYDASSRSECALFSYFVSC